MYRPPPYSNRHGACALLSVANGCAFISFCSNSAAANGNGAACAVAHSSCALPEAIRLPLSSVWSQTFRGSSDATVTLTAAVSFLPSTRARLAVPLTVIRSATVLFSATTYHLPSAKVVVSAVTFSTFVTVLILSFTVFSSAAQVRFTASPFSPQMCPGRYRGALCRYPHVWARVPPGCP